MMKRILLLCLLCGWYVGLRAQQQEALQRLLSTDGLKQASVGISVRSVADGSVVLEHQAEMALTPASVAKLLSTWLALRCKGEEFRYQTLICHTGELKDSVLTGDLVIVAGGDPTLDSRYFPQNPFVSRLVELIQQKGIMRIEGKIRVEGAVRGEEIPGSWLWEDISNYYGAIYLPFNYRDNLFTLTFRTEQPGARASLLSCTPFLPGVDIQNEVLVSEENKKDAWIYGGPYSEVLVVRGSLPPHQSALKVRGVLHDPATVFVAELKGELLKKQIKVEEQELATVDKKVLDTLQSPSLSEIVYHTNKVSVNLFAEALGELLGEKEGVENLKEQMEQLGYDLSGVTLKDVCGLSLMNAVPAGLFTDLLLRIEQQPSEAFFNSLPVGGTDGGLSGYCMAAPKLNGRMHAKTGSMSGVRCLAGYLTRRDGSRLAFTILVNHYTCSPAQLQRSMGQFLSSFL